MSSVDILVKGRNRLLLFEKLKRVGVAILRSEEKSPSEIVIRVKYKDYNKVIEILKNIWYNDTISYNGVVGAIRFFKAHAALLLSVAVFIVSLFFVNDLLFFTEINGVSKYHEKRISSILKSEGIKPFSRFSDIDNGDLENSILADNERIAFVSVKKAGNTLVVSARYNSEENEVLKKPKKIVAKHDGVIKSLTVIRGRAIKFVGDTVKVGETIVEGIIEDGDREFEDYAVAIITIECKVRYSTIVNDTSEAAVKREIETLRAILDREDAAASISFDTGGGQIILDITFTFSVTEDSRAGNGG